MDRCLFQVIKAAYAPVAKEHESAGTHSEQVDAVVDIQEATDSVEDDVFAEANINHDKVIIFDGMAVLQSIKKTPAMKKITDLKKAFVKRINNLMKR